MGVWCPNQYANWTADTVGPGQSTVLLGRRGAAGTSGPWLPTSPSVFPLPAPVLGIECLTRAPSVPSQVLTQPGLVIKSTLRPSGPRGMPCREG